jgi:hypothetical protein
MSHGHDIAAVMDALRLGGGRRCIGKPNIISFHSAPVLEKYGRTTNLGSCWDINGRPGLAKDLTWD